MAVLHVGANTEKPRSHAADSPMRNTGAFVPVFPLVHKKGGPETAVNAGIVDNSVDKVEKDRG